MSEVERGTTRPTSETLAWLAERLGVERHFLEIGLSSKEYDRAEARIAHAEAAVESHDYVGGVSTLESIRGLLAPEAAPELEFRALLTEGWARMHLGQIREASERLLRARAIAEAPPFTDLDRAEVLFRLACCRYELASISTAVGLFNEALALAEGSGLPCDRLKSRIFRWRARCYRRQRDWEAAREDVEQALELADRVNDRRAIADAHFFGSLIAERQGRWAAARSYAERARAVYEEIDDRANVGKQLTTLGALTFLLGKKREGVRYLKEAVGVALEVGSDVDAARAVSTLAQVHIRTGKPEVAEQQARRALQLLAGRTNLSGEIGNAQLLLGRALLEQGRLDEAERELAAAEKSFNDVSSASDRAAAWTAQADLAARRGDQDTAVRLYRTAVEALQDFRF